MRYEVEHCRISADHRDALDQRDDAPFLAGRSFVSLYPEVIAVTVRRRGKTVAEWPVPMVRGEAGIELRRPFRLLPYTLLTVAADLHEGEIRRCVEAIAQYVISPGSGISAVELPLTPDAVGCSPFLTAGFDIYQRHTYVIDLKTSWERNFSQTCANNIRHAAPLISVLLESEPASFDCERGITDEGGDALARRSSLITRLLAHRVGVVASAYQRGAEQMVVGQCFMAWDNQSGYLLHSWRRPSAPRGTMNVLLARLMRYAHIDLRLGRFDLEGSVITGVDRFYSTFGGRQTPYAWLSWKRGMPPRHSW